MSARPRPCWITPRPISSVWKRCTARVESRLRRATARAPASTSPWSATRMPWNGSTSSGRPTPGGDPARRGRCPPGSGQPAPRADRRAGSLPEAAGAGDDPGQHRPRSRRPRRRGGAARLHGAHQPAGRRGAQEAR